MREYSARRMDCQTDVVMVILITAHFARTMQWQVPNFSALVVLSSSYEGIRRFKHGGVQQKVGKLMNGELRNN
jgi:hypothetical protein